MRCVCMLAMIMTSFLCAMAAEKLPEQIIDDHTITGAAYFVINIPNAYTIYRARQATLYDGFYTDNFKLVLQHGGSFVSFHDKNTEIRVCFYRRRTAYPDHRHGGGIYSICSCNQVPDELY